MNLIVVVLLPMKIF